MKFQDIEMAYDFVSFGQQFMNHAYISRKTGETYYVSELGDSDELPDDIDDPDIYIAIPDKRELNLGKNLVFDFVSQYLPNDYDQVSDIFRSSGAYSRYKDLLERRGLLNDWHAFEEDAKKKRLMAWCKENDIHFT